MNKDRMLQLDSQLCFVLYACSRSLTRLYRPLLKQLGVTYPQYLVLLVLWQEKKKSVTDLGDRLLLDSGTLTPLLKRMETGGLIVRTRSLEDERKVMIRLTPKGSRLKEQAYEIPEKLFCRSGLNMAEFFRIKGDLERLLEQIRHNGEAAKNA